MVLGLVGGLQLPRPAFSQEGGGWLVLPTLQAAEDVRPEVIQNIVRQLEGRGLPVLGVDEAVRLFSARASRAAVAVDPSVVTEIERVVDELLTHVAMGLQRLAHQDMTRLEELVLPSHESLARDERAARAMQDGCLHFVRVLLYQRQRERAKDQALRCMNLFPGIEPDIHLHPPDVFGLLGEVRAELLAQTLGTLRVDSDRPGCAVFLNGIEVGRTPLDVPRLVAGEYRVQVECPGDPAREGRVHRVVVAAERRVLFVDSQLDRALESSPLLALRYPDAQQADGMRLAHARAVARVLDAAEILLVASGSGHSVRLDRLGVNSARVAASAVVSVEPAQVARFGDQTRAAIDALGRGESLAFDVEPPVAMEPWAAPPLRAEEPQQLRSATPAATPPLQSGPGRRSIDYFGMIVAAVGTATLGTGWALWATDVSDLNTTAAFAVAGGTFAAAGYPYVLPKHDGVPWWAWTAGVAGVGLSAWGVWALTEHGECAGGPRLSTGECRIVVRSADAGALLIASAVPLLEIPLLYLLDPALASEEQRRPRAFIDLGERGALAGLAGGF